MDKRSEERVALAVELFNSGFNCAQAVSAAWADSYGLSREQMLLAAASFGGGIGRMRKTCGAACGMFILAGFESGSTNPADRERKGANYALVQKLADEFARRNGALECHDLLTGNGVKSETSASPEARTAEYYKKRPCPRIVQTAAQIWLDYLNGKL